MEDNKRFYAVVYQMGKVASTSLVATLNDIPGVEATQSHFLGEVALKEIIPTITCADVSDYFAEHQLGQLIANVRITRKIARIREGLEKQDLFLLALARDPIDWFRSSLTQDIQGYLPILEAYAKSHSLASDFQAKTVAASLSSLLELYVSYLDSVGGIDAFIDLRSKKAVGFEGRYDALLDPGVQRIFYMMLRPYSWFSLHFERALGIQISTMSSLNGIFTYLDGPHRFFIVKYEDLPGKFLECLEISGISGISVIKAENLSESKLYSSELREVFSVAAKEMRKMSANTTYSRMFGYS